MSLPIFSPVLRAKLGEIDAIGRLSGEARSMIEPVLDIPNPRKSSPQQVSEHIAAVLTAIRDSWGTAAPLYLDFSRFEPDTRLERGEHLVEFAFRISRELRLKARPATGSISGRGLTDDYTAALRDAAEKVLVRLDPEEFASQDSLEAALGRLIDALRIAPDRVDVMLDAHAISDAPSAESLEHLATNAIAATRALSDAGYRRVFFGGSSYPDPMSKLSRKQVVQVPCHEWNIWKRITDSVPGSVVGFTSYGVVHPRQSDSGKSGRPPSRVRLVTERGYVIFRGSPHEIRDVCSTALKSGSFANVVDSWGLGELRACADGRGGAGNATNWIARDTAMHLEHVALALRSELGARGVPLPSSERSAGHWLQSVI